MSPRILLLSLLLCLLPVSAQAFDLGDLQQRLAATPSLAGSFEQQRYLADLDSTLDSRGRFRFVRGERVVWQLEAPVEERIELTPEAITSGSGDQAPPGGEQVAQLFLQLLEGDWQALESRFSITLSGEAAQWTVNLIPREAALRERIERIILNGGERYLQRLEMQTPTGDRLHVRLFDQHTLAPDA
ncbi:outer membrane lipoprotein carrier protein LolA [Salinicola avicenniae]|uniref:outer membrane lipoprotein carrier protein LolA n=1 Tax=Salinicola avicenniae TaxID=2916836 RepID=UPI00207336E8|nr:MULTISPECIES: outer membrane lipoprotein carrier protein LolA [unclassified Salinicola]